MRSSVLPKVTSGGDPLVNSGMPSSLSGGQISPEVELDHFFTSLIGKDAAGGLTLLTQPGADGRGGGRLSPPLGPSPACSLPPSPFRDMPYWDNALVDGSF